MQIKKFKLLEEGFNGVEIDGSMFKNKGTLNVLVEFKGLKYKAPVPREIVQMVQGLKFALLKFTSILPEEAEDFFDTQYDLPKLEDYQKSFNKDLYAHTQSLMQKLFITGFFYDGDNLIVTGKILGYEDLTFTINTPKIRFDMIRMDFEESTEKLIRSIMKEVKGFINSIKFRKMGSKQYLLDLWKGDEEKLQSIKALSEEDAEKTQIEELEKKGFIVISAEEVMDDITKTNEETKITYESEVDPIPKAQELKPEKPNAKPPFVEEKRVWTKEEVDALPPVAKGVPSKKAKVFEPTK